MEKACSTEFPQDGHVQKRVVNVYEHEIKEQAG
jgi:hypothetical protein